MKSEADSDTGARVFYCMEERRDMNHEASTDSFRRERVKEKETILFRDQSNKYQSIIVTT